MAQGVEFDQRTNSFLSWFKSLEGASFSDAIQIVDLRSKNAGRGIVATQDIPADMTLFEIPRKAIINVQTSELPSKLPGVFDRESEAMDVDGDVSPQLDSWSSLILIMIYEFLRGQESQWKAYFDVLPEEFNTPMFWSDSDLDALQASATRGKVGKSEAEEMFRSQLLPVIRSNQSVFMSSEARTDEELIGLAHRMGSTIMAYAFDLENDEDREEEEEDGWVEDRDGKSLMGMAHINHGEESLTATSLRPIKAGEEILNYYGPHPNSELLRRYGYVTERHGRYDVVEIPWGVAEEALAAQLSVPADVISACKERLDEEELEDVFVLERDTGEPNSDGTFAGPAELKEMPGDLQEQVKAFLKGIKKLKPDLIPDKRKRDEILSDVMLNSLQLLESRYPTSYIEDRMLLKRTDLSDRIRMAVEVRLGEKQLIQEAKALFQSSSNENAGKRVKTST
uniref:SET domain-containing protein n=1 Tax=Bionectria ochroleuca TaxID=29856 RepID=A0A0B7K6K7_BIOOC